MGPGGHFFNYGAIHLVTTSTTRRLGELAPNSRFDPHRFRPNVVIDTCDEGFLETAWQGKTIAIGDARLAVTMTVARCVMTTLAQGDFLQTETCCVPSHGTTPSTSVVVSTIRASACMRMWLAKRHTRRRSGDGGLISARLSIFGSSDAAYAWANPTRAGRICDGA